MIPLALVTGFLGSGKTTWLARLARTYAARGGPPVAFLINEFAGTDADSPHVAPLADITLGVSGGSIFCRCKVTEFLDQLTALPRLHPQLGGVVIEASGMADPGAARVMLDESGLDRVYDWRGCVALADPGSLLKVLDTLAAAERQIACADVVLLNKCDLHAETKIAATEAAIRAIHPTVDLRRTVQADCDLDPLALDADRWFDGELTRCADPQVVAVEAALGPVVDPALIADGLAALGDGLLRAKGFLPRPDGWQAVDWAGGHLHWRDGIAGPARLVILVRPAAVEAARALALRLELADGD
jgi:G3E family GTPase